MPRHRRYRRRRLRPHGEGRLSSISATQESAASQGGTVSTPKFTMKPTIRLVASDNVFAEDFPFPFDRTLAKNSLTSERPFLLLLWCGRSSTARGQKSWAPPLTGCQEHHSQRPRRQGVAEFEAIMMQLDQDVSNSEANQLIVSCLARVESSRPWAAWALLCLQHWICSSYGSTRTSSGLAGLTLRHKVHIMLLHVIA